MKKILGITVLLFSPLLTLSCSNASHKYIYEYTYDGDTIRFQDNIRGRLFGIDAPEMKINNEVTKGLQRHFAVKSRDYLSNYLINKKAQIKYLKHDKYGRDVIKVFANGKDMSKELVAQGLAIVRYITNNKFSPFFTKDEKYMKDLYDLQYDAWKHKRGIWNYAASIKEIYKKK